MGPIITSAVDKWWATMKVAWSQTFVYRLNFFLQVIGPSLVFLFIKYSLWAKVYEHNPEQLIQGYNFQQMITYHLWVLVVSLIGQGHTGMNLAEDIRMGRISTYLIYPFNFWEFHTAQFLSFQSIQLLTSFFTLLVLLILGLLQLQLMSMDMVLYGFFFTLYVSFFWFAVQFLLGLMSFWLEETWVLRVIFQIIAQFLSGAIIPLEFFPSWGQNILSFTPFPLLTYVPVKIFMGEYQEANILQGIFLLSAWMLVLIWLNKKVWRKGMKLYTAAGM